jgi:hypothetical protein
MKNSYEVYGDITYISLNRKDGTIITTIIDTDDLPIADNFPNTFNMRDRHVSGTLPQKNKHRELVMLHRLVMRVVDESLLVDHINGNTLDNRKSNLRIVNKSANGQNISKPPAHNTSGTVNVSWNSKSSAWLVALRVNKKFIYLGSFRDKERAKMVEFEARKRYMPYSREGVHSVRVDPEVPGRI